MQVPRTAAPRADSQCPGQVRFRAGGKCCCFFVPHMNPLDLLLPAYSVGDSVERIARHPIHSLNPCFRENLHHPLRYFFGHKPPFLRFVSPKVTMLQPCSWYRRLHVFLVPLSPPQATKP